ncbi:MAG: alpha/beta hydrolase, partial [Planctomycetota bacterium]
CHGNGEHVAYMAEELEFFRDEFEASVFAFDYRGYGKSEGEPTEAGVYADTLAAWKHLTESRGIPAERIVVLGRSLGSALAVELATHEAVDSLVLVSPLTSGRAVANAGGLWLISWLAGNPFPSLDRIETVKASTLFIHGTNDEVIPYEHGRELYGAHPGPKRFETVEGAGHNDLTQVGGQTYWEAIRTHLDRYTPLRGGD